MHEWQFYEAKNKLSQVFDLVDKEGVQYIRRGKGKQYMVVPVKAESTKPSFIDMLLSAPKCDELDFSRNPTPSRNIKF